MSRNRELSITPMNNEKYGAASLFPRKSEVLSDEEIEKLKAAVRKLSRPQKLLALLYCYDKLSLSQLSQVLEISADRISSILMTAMNCLCRDMPGEKVSREDMCRVFSEEIEAQIIDPDSYERLKKLLSDIAEKLG